MSDEIAAIAAKYGVPVNEAMTGIKTGAKVAAKYRNPSNPSEEWSGRGRQPLWVKAHADKNNGNLDALLIEAPKTVETSA